MCAVAFQQSQQSVIYDNLQSLKPTFFANRKPQQFNQIDLQGLSLGKDQFINLKYQKNQFDQKVNLKIGIKYFGPLTNRQKDIQFKIYIQQSFTTKCPQNLHGISQPYNPQIQNLHCQSIQCNYLHSGYDCSNKKQPIFKGKIFKTQISQFQRVNVVIPIAQLIYQKLKNNINPDEAINQKQLTNSISVQILIKNSNCIIYFQDSFLQDPIANPFNANLIINTSNDNSYNSPHIYIFTVKGNYTQFLSMTFQKYSDGKTQISVYYNDYQNSVVIPSIVLCLSLIIVCGFTIFVIWSFSRMQILHRGLNQMQLAAILRNRNNNKLPQALIQKYFPSLQFSLLLDYKKKYQMNKKVQKDKQFDQELFQKDQKDVQKIKLIQMKNMTDKSNIQFSESTIQNQINISDENRDKDKMIIDENSQCAICIMKIQRNQQVVLTYCGHLFHKWCLYQWFNNQTNCPNCRQIFTQSSVLQKYKTLVNNYNNNLIERGQPLEQIQNQALVFIIYQHLYINQNKSKERNYI